MGHGERWQKHLCGHRKFKPQPYKLISGQTITWGAWSALDATTGKILWQTPDPTQGTIDESSVSVANGVLYAGSLDTAGHMYALNSFRGRKNSDYDLGEVGSAF